MVRYFLSFLLLLLFSCASDKPTGQTEAEVLFKEAENLMQDGRYILATEKLNQLKNQYPYSVYATPSELLMADILFKQESYIESAAAYLLFRDFHPRHEKIPYVVFMIAESYFKQIPDTFDRDLQPAFEAIKYFQELKQKYPDSKYATKANKKMKKASRMIQDKEQYVADFYFKTKNYSAAKWRYLDILDNFKDKKLITHSKRRIVLTTFYLKEWKECVDFFDRYKKFLDSDKRVNNIVTRCKSKLN